MNRLRMKLWSARNAESNVKDTIQTMTHFLNAQNAIMNTSTTEKTMTTTKEMIEQYLKDKQEKDKIERRPPANNEFYASSAGMCPRKLFFDRTIGQKETNIETTKIFLLGDLVHGFLQDKIFKEGVSEQRIELEVNGVKVRGRLDHMDDDFIYEFKSTNSLAYVTQAPNEHHLMQLNLYLEALGRKKGKIIYVEKNTFQVVEHEVEYDPKIVEGAITIFKEAKDGILSNTAPAVLEGFPKNWKCTNKAFNCDWYQECKDLHQKDAFINRNYIPK